MTRKSPKVARDCLLNFILESAQGGCDGAVAGDSGANRRCWQKCERHDQGGRDRGTGAAGAVRGAQ